MEKSIVPVNQLAVRSSTGYEFSNSNPAEVVELEDDPVEIVEKQLEDLKLNHQFNEKDVPEIFQTLIEFNRLKEIDVHFDDQYCWITFDGVYISWDKKGNDWLIRYPNTKDTITSTNPEKSIMDHLWFVLKNPNIDLAKLEIIAYQESELELNRQAQDSGKPDLKKLNTLLQSMLDSIDHQIQIKSLNCTGFNEDTFSSMLKHIKPGILEELQFEISWKEEGNYQKLDEIIETDQWKQATDIISPRVTPLKIENLLHCKFLFLTRDPVTPEEVFQVIKHVFNSASNKKCLLAAKNWDLDIDAIISFLIVSNDGLRITKTRPTQRRTDYRYVIAKSGKFVFLNGSETGIIIGNFE